MGTPKRFSEIFASKLIVNPTDYTAFEVYAHDEEIPVGDSVELGGYVNVAIAASMTEQFSIITEKTDATNNQNVIVDWGDGTTSALRDAGTDPNVTVSDYTGYNAYKYNCNHTYTTPGKYIVKIFGDMYYWFMHENTDIAKNIVCRAFDKDLPLASVVSKLSAAFRACQLLLNFKMPINTAHRVDNIANMFNGCKNLLSATGFSSGFQSLCQCNNAFAGCSQLTTTDFKLPTIVYSSSASSGITSLMHGCQKLNVDLVDLLSNWQPLPGQTINLTKTFTTCKALTCSDINYVAERLWNNHNVNWVLPTNAGYLPFAGCNTIKAMIPTSWGGTASDNMITKSDAERIKELEEELRKVDCTAFEVIPHSIDFIGGEQSIKPFIPDYMDSVTFDELDAVFDSEGVNSITFNTRAELEASPFYQNNSYGVMVCSNPLNTRLSSMKTFYTNITENTTNTYQRVGILQHTLLAQTTETFRFYCHQFGGEVYIDWGDGVVDHFDPADSASIPAGYTVVLGTSNYRVTASHDYSPALTAAGLDYKKFIVQISGQSVYRIVLTEENQPNNNLVCRVFGDLPVSRFLDALDSFATGSNHMVVLDLLTTHPISAICNYFNCFADCHNLLVAIGFRRFGDKIGTFSNFFSGDALLINTDFRLPSVGISDTSSGSIKNAFNNNKSLGGGRVMFKHKNGYVSTINTPTVATLLPGAGFDEENLDVSQVFYNCKQLSLGRNNEEILFVGDVLWRDTNRVRFLNTSSCFASANNTLRAQVPVSWGGTYTYTPSETTYGDLTVYGGEQFELENITDTVVLNAGRIIPPEKEITIFIKVDLGASTIPQLVLFTPGATTMTCYGQFTVNAEPGSCWLCRIKGNMMTMSELAEF